MRIINYVYNFSEFLYYIYCQPYLQGKRKSKVKEINEEMKINITYIQLYNEYI